MISEEKWLELKEFLQEEYAWIDPETTTGPFDRGVRRGYKDAIDKMDEMESKEKGEEK